jgi:membrane protein YqaA with SNARE-associated domain
MKIFSRLSDRALHWSRHCRRHLAVSFTESSFFPYRRRPARADDTGAAWRWWRLAALTASLGPGGLLGYAIGYLRSSRHAAAA